MDRFFLHYILVDRVPTPVEDVMEYYRWREEAEMQVALTRFQDGSYISTVFLGIDHSSNRLSGPPILFETMVFGGPKDGLKRRYATWDEAETGHKQVVELVFAVLN